MRAVVINTEKELEVGDRKKPELQEGQLLVEVHAAGVNRTDLIRRKKMSASDSYIMGVEVAGVIVDGDTEGTDFVLGDKVMGLVNGGGYSEYALLPADRAMKIPPSFRFEEAAAIPEVFLTAYQTLFWHGKLSEKETVLIHAGGSGVGTAAIQLAKVLCDAKIITTAGSQRKLDFCKNLGAHVLINYKEQSFDEEVLKSTDDKGVDVILDFIGASYWEKNMKSIKKGGHWVLIGMLGGSTVDEVDLSALLSNYITLVGTLLSPRSEDYKAKLTHEFVEKVIPLMEKGSIMPIVDKVFSLEDAEKAHAYMEDSHNIGKIILKVKG